MTDGLIRNSILIFAALFLTNGDGRPAPPINANSDRANANPAIRKYQLPKFHPTQWSYWGGQGEPFYKSRTVQVALPLIVVGGVLIGNDVAFRDMRNDYLGRWRYHYDDFVQYSPAALMLGLKAFGLHGRSSWGRMLTSSAFAVAGTLIMANGTKLLRLRERPDGADRRSFPSGHTATAFMTATLLHKEYGTTVSPWFSVAGYTIAAGVGVSRVLNNKHWVSDILAGAGIGILAGELGYYIADKIFRLKGLRPTSEIVPADNAGRPSFAGLTGGGVILPSGRHNGHSLLYSGVSSGVHGAWFVNRLVGFGGQLAAMNAKYRGRDAYSAFGTDALMSSINIVSAQAGAYLSKTIGRRWLLSGKLLSGVSVNYGICNSANANRANGDTARRDRMSGSLAYGGDNNCGDAKPGIFFPRRTSFIATVGGAMTFVANNHFGVRAYADIAAFGCRITTTAVNGSTVERNTETRILFPMSFGLSFDIMMW